jgi:hypothetical protein
MKKKGKQGKKKERKRQNRGPTKLQRNNKKGEKQIQGNEILHINSVFQKKTKYVCIYVCTLDLS